MNSSQSDFNLLLPDAYLVRSYLITYHTMFLFVMRVVLDLKSTYFKKQRSSSLFYLPEIEIQVPNGQGVLGSLVLSI